VSRRRLLLTGASGFLGRHVAAAIGAAEPATGLRVMVHRSAAASLPPGTDRVTADLADPASLSGICEGVDAVVHAASWIGDDPLKCDRINAGGTAALVDEAARAGVRRFVYLSNAAVYGWAVHAGATESECRAVPATPVSRSRAQGERAVLAVGGAVLRPLFVYGDGDTRFLPAIMRAQRRFPFVVDRGRARLSVVSATELGEAAVALALAETGAASSGVFHVSEAEPLSYADIAAHLARHFHLPIPRLSLPYPVARWILRAAAGGILGSDRWSPSASHRLFLVARDHFYDAARLRATLGRPAGDSFRQRLPDLVPWYVRFVDQPRKRSDAA
jgi:nucleoside-diphosphate-sugar epimerase